MAEAPHDGQQVDYDEYEAEPISEDSVVPVEGLATQEPELVDNLFIMQI